MMATIRRGTIGSAQGSLGPESRLGRPRMLLVALSIFVIWSRRYRTPLSPRA